MSRFRFSDRAGSGPRPSVAGSDRRRLIAFEFLEGHRPPAVLHVGPTEPYKLPSQAAAAARDGDAIKIDAGTYAGDVARWTRTT